MSTVKTDAIVAVSTNGDLSLDGLGTGGVSIASTLKMAKGGDIASASPLVIDTDGNYFDVTGTTNFSIMTVESGNFFMLQFDSALTITHGSGIELPGAANLTTATGDRLMCYATAANTVEVMSVETEAAASAGGFTLGTPVASTSGTVITFGSIPSGTTMIVINLVGVSTNGNSQTLEITLGDAGGLETTGYTSANWGVSDETNFTLVRGTTFFQVYRTTTFDAATVLNAVIYLSLVDSSAFTWNFHAVSAPTDTDGAGEAIGSKSLSQELTQVSVTTSGSSTWDLGTMNIMYQ
jgi:hypothetical protein